MKKRGMLRNCWKNRFFDPFKIFLFITLLRSILDVRRQINSIIISVIVGLIWNAVWLEFAKGKNDYEFPVLSS